VRPNRRVWSTIVVVLSAVVTALVQPAAASAATLAPASAAALAPASAAALAPAQVRVNQVGYPAYAPKVAYAMLPRKVASVRFEVVTPYGVAYRGTSTDDTAYEDNVVAWPSVEPASDYTANSLLAFALGAAGLG
jgi:Cellulase N-terminal ig-like domain